MIKKLLVANRGEIAVRIIRAARELGIRTVAVYSDADARAIHVALADEAFPVGPSEAAESYLREDRILAAASEAGADAIHPGYGFLSERASFSEACLRAAITFVGPPPEAMRKLGGKIDAKRIAESAGVPIAPGFFVAGATTSQLREAAARIGYPIMLKASAGGGGRGMRIVRQESQFESELAIASDEALKGFGDGAMMVEKLIERPRHIEVQILADQHGQVACLFERECSIQRRHQKLIEEAPSPVMDEEHWIRLMESCKRLAQAAGYIGAGTAEFMFDQATGDSFFLEVNARLQVEHPVTEAVTGLDLVQWQLRIASGERLDLPEAIMAGDRAAISGHAIEARIVAEDPARGFLPSSGKIVAWAEPKMPGVRVDTGFGPGAEISRHYDSLIAKVIAHAETREAAVRRLREALLDFHILGVSTNISYLLAVLGHEAFRRGDLDTAFLVRHFADWSQPEAIPEELLAIAGRAAASGASPDGSRAPGAWGLSDGFRIAR